MKKLLILLAVLAGCENPSDSKETIANAYVIGFNSEKCGCCWGWVIEQNGDTIKTTDSYLESIIGYEITEPIPVILDLGEMTKDCSSSINNVLAGNKNYYSIESVKLVE